MNKFLKKFLVMSFAISTINFSQIIFQNHFQIFSAAHAEIKNYEGEGFFAFKDETLDYSKNKAKEDAVRNIAEKIFVEVQSNSEIKNSELIHDEIILKTESFMKIFDIKYHIEPGDENYFIVHAIVRAEVDTDEIEKILKKHNGKTCHE